jgi:hypothetical protein
MIGGNYYSEYTLINDKNVNDLILISSTALILIFIKHIEPLNELTKKNKKNKND